MYSTTLLDDGEESPFALEEADGDSEPALEDEVVAVPDVGLEVLCSSCAAYEREILDGNLRLREASDTHLVLDGEVETTVAKSKAPEAVRFPTTPLEVILHAT